MKCLKLRNIKKLYFSPADAAGALGIAYASAKVSCARYAKAGFIIRLKRNIYILAEEWPKLFAEQTFTIANILEVPSYISLTTALSYYGLSTQLQQDFIESISVKRTKDIEICGRQFEYSKIQRRYYNNFVKKEGFFIALPEKAVADALYLMALKKYKLDIDALDIGKLDKAKLAAILKQYPENVRILWRKICRT